MFQGRPLSMSPDMNMAGLLGVGGPEGMMLNMVLQPMLGKFLGDKFMSAQFLPMGNLYNQYRDKALFAAQQEAMRRGSEVDQQTYIDMFAGMAQMAGTPFGVRERRAASTLAGDMSRIMPMIAPMAPEMFDRLHGSRGSALIMAQQMNLGGRYQIDPVTGRTGLTGDSVSQLTRRVYDRLYGPDADVREMKGLGAGRAGQLYDEMSRRGLMGSGLSRDASLERIATAQNTTVAELRKLDNPTLDMKLRQFEADRIADKLKNMAGAVAAMQDIFGEMGQPDAPMSMLMNGLQMLTQNGMQSMSPEQVERMVRTTSNIARAGGMDMTAMMQLVATAAQRGDQFGLDRRFAATSAQGAAAFATAYGNMAGGMRRWGMADKDKAAALAVQLETNAAASPIAQQLATVMRLQEEFGGFKEGTEAKAIYEALARGDTEYTFGGAKKSVYLPSGYGEGSFLDVMQKGGMRGDVVEKVRYQTATNQKTIADKNLTAQARALQGKADIEPRLFQVFSSTMQGSMTEEMRKDDKLVDAMNAAVSDVARSQLDLAPEDMLNDQIISKQMLESLKRQGIAVTPEIEGRVREASKLMVGNWEERVRQDPGLRGYGSGINALLMNNRKIMREKNLLQIESDQEGRLQSAFAQLGRAGPAQRLADALLKAGPATNFNDVVAGVFGFQDKDEVTRIFGTKLEDLKKEAEAFRNVDPTSIRKEFEDIQKQITAAQMKGPSGAPEVAILEAQRAALGTKYGVRWDQVAGMEDRHIGIAAREAAIERAKKYLPDIARIMDKHGFVQTRIATADVNRAAMGIRSGRGSSLDDIELLTERFMMDEKAMSTLGEGGLDRLENVRARARRMKELADGLGISADALLSGNFSAQGIDFSEAGKAKMRVGLEESLARLDGRTPVEAMKAEATRLRTEAAPDTWAALEAEARSLEQKGDPESVAKARKIRDDLQARRGKLTKATVIEQDMNLTPEAKAAKIKKIKEAQTHIDADAAAVTDIRGKIRDLTARGKADDEAAKAIGKASGLGEVGLDKLMAQVDATDEERAKADAINKDFQAKSKLREEADAELQKARGTPGADTDALTKKRDALKREEEQARGRLMQYSDETGISVDRLLMSEADRTGAKKSKLADPESQKKVRELWNRARADSKTQGDLFDQLQKIADARYGGNMLGLINDPELARAFIGNERRALEVMTTDLGMSFSKGVDRSAGFTDDYKTRMKDVQRLLSLDSKGAVDELLQLTGSKESIDAVFRDATGREVKGSNYLAEKLKDSGKLQEVLPALKRMQEIGLGRMAEKELKAAGTAVTPESLKKKIDELKTDPGKVREAIGGFIDAKDEDLTPQQREDRKRLMTRLGGDAGLVGILKKITSGTANAEDIDKALAAMPELRREVDKADAKNATTVKLSPDTRFTGTFDITTGKMDMRPIGQPGT
jgi:hypothetical protein